MNLFRRIYLVFTAGPELDEFVKQRKAQKEAQELEARKHYLKLCKKHQQEPNHSHYGEKNCDYCKLLVQRHLRRGTSDE